jgi:catechol 2,3-dioxygenase-like lactoylglutathione lyase family enzyme
MRWTHVTLRVSDLDRSIGFYERTCGLEVVRDRRLEGGGTVWLGMRPRGRENPSFVLVLDPGEVTDRIDHLGFQCEERTEVDAIAAEAKRSGSLVTEPKDSGGTVGYWCLLRDPDGHRVEFTHGQPIEGVALRGAPIGGAS